MGAGLVALLLAGLGTPSGAVPTRILPWVTCQWSSIYAVIHPAVSALLGRTGPQPCAGGHPSAKPPFGPKGLLSRAGCEPGCC